MNTRRTLAALALVALSLSAPPAAAQAPAQQDELIERVVVRNRLYSPRGRLEASVGTGLTLLSHFTDHYDFTLGVAYNLWDTLAVEGRGGYALSRHTGLANRISETFLRRTDVRQTDEMEDMWQLGLHAAGGLRWAPVYGKLSLLADLPVHFQSYLWLGAGAGQLTRQSIIECTRVVDRDGGVCDNRTDPLDPSTATESYWQKESRAAPIASGAVGFRFFVGDRHGVRLELRDWAWMDSYRVENVRAEWEAGQPTGKAAANPGLTHLVQFDVGYTILF